MLAPSHDFLLNELKIQCFSILTQDIFHEVVKQLGQLSCFVHPGTHLEVQNCLNACSIFAGSNPFVSELIIVTMFV